MQAAPSAHKAEEKLPGGQEKVGPRVGLQPAAARRHRVTTRSVALTGLGVCDLHHRLLRLLSSHSAGQLPAVKVDSEIAGSLEAAASHPPICVQPSSAAETSVFDCTADKHI